MPVFWEYLPLSNDTPYYQIVPLIPSQTYILWEYK